MDEVVKRMRGFVGIPNGVNSQGADAWFPGQPRTALIYTLLVLRANYKDGATPLPRQRITLKTGQLVMGREEFEDQFGWSQQTFRTTMKQLESNRWITRHGSVITILNYIELFASRPTGQPGHNQDTTRTQPHQHNAHGTNHILPPVVPRSSGDSPDRESPQPLLPAGQKPVAKRRKPPNPTSPTPQTEDEAASRLEALERKSEKARERRAGTRARQLTVLAIGAVFNDLGDAEARQSIGPQGWRLLMVKFKTFDRYRNAYLKANRERVRGGSDATTFEAQLRESFKALLLVEQIAPKAEKLTLIQGGAD